MRLPAYLVGFVAGGLAGVVAMWACRDAASAVFCILIGAGGGYVYCEYKGRN